MVIYDIFGFFDQTVQGADILATSSETKYQVFIPDWFKGEPCPIEWWVQPGGTNSLCSACRS